MVWSAFSTGLHQPASLSPLSSTQQGPWIAAAADPCSRIFAKLSLCCWVSISYSSIWWWWATCYLPSNEKGNNIFLVKTCLLKSCFIFDSHTCRLWEDFRQQTSDWLDDAEIYSLHDLMRVNSGELYQILRVVVTRGMNHVIECEVWTRIRYNLVTWHSKRDTTHSVINPRNLNEFHRNTKDNWIRFFFIF